MSALPVGTVPVLRERVVVISPHCDDAVLSLGATLRAHTKRGGRAVVVTALAGDPHSGAPAGPWDAAAGFCTEGEATRVRRSEDVAACRRLGAEHVHVDEVDEQYPRRHSRTGLWRRLAPTLLDCDELLLPGFPLHNADHAEVTHTVLAHIDPDTPVRLYLEEPYALRERAADGRGDTWDGHVSWGSTSTVWRDAAAKLRASACYGSQLPMLAPGRMSPPSAVGALVTQCQLWWAAQTRGEWCTPPLPAGQLAQVLRS